MNNKIEVLSFDGRTKIDFPLFVSRVKAGFPSPADDYIEKQLDFNEYLVQHPAATFCVKASGDSMINAGIHSGDILVVDRALTPKNNSVIIAVVNGELTVKRMQIHKNEIYLISENPAYAPLLVKEEDFEVWGVVTYVLHKTK